MEILLFCPSPRTADGGLERVFGKIGDGLRTRGHIVHTVYCGPEMRQVGEGKNLSWDVPLEHLRTRHKFPRVGSSIRVLRDARRLHRLISQIQPDVVNCHFASFYSLYFCALKFLHGYKLVISVHGRDVKGGTNPLQRLIRPWILRAADYVTGVSSALEARAQECAGEPLRSSTIYNGVDINYWKSVEESKKKCPSCSHKPVIANVGALRNVKGQDILLHAFARLRASEVEAQLWLVGDGQRRDELEHLASQLEIEDHVTFHGWCSRDEVRETLRESTVFAFPSRNEGFGMAALEAMAAGTPVVASKVGGLPEIITSSEEGRLVSSEDPEQLAGALKEVLRTPEIQKRLARGARRRARDFQWESTIEQYEELFLSLHS
ncbi:glycosyltransferase family 4 protein [Salinibacter sp.]|uniref:glycosyltransferase family 4 protein n=1 Tax=Salinibacter sp. TaxID=2065818 RepID=UPI0021E94370|nr:glycosyltransferase family 4 protein [Salinibacter sp.]